MTAAKGVVAVAASILILIVVAVICIIVMLTPPASSRGDRSFGGSFDIVRIGGIVMPATPSCDLQLPTLPLMEGSVDE